MRSIFQITKDIRDTAKIANELADELDQIFAVFAGGPALATPFVAKPVKNGLPKPPSQSQNQNSRPKSYKGVKATEQQKLLIRQLWFSLPQPKQTIESKREIAERVGLHVAMVSTIIRRTRTGDLKNFLKTQAPSGSVARGT